MSDASCISTISQLPPEILAKIFLHVTDDKGVHIVDPDPYPWRLALVCRLWRDVAFSTPRLWSSLDVQLDSIQRSSLGVRGDALVAVLKLCLRRSGDRPLTIALRTSPETRVFIPALLDTLVNNADRWETMKLSLPFDILVPFISDPDIRYPRLRRLLLQGRGVLGSGKPHPLQLFQNAPLLSQLEFHEFSYSPLTLKFPWSQITGLTARLNPHLGIRQLFDGLQNMPNISSLVYSQLVDMSVSPTPPPNQVLRLPHLRRLTWRTYMSNGAPFFDWICAPKLSEIELTCADDHWDSDTMRRFLRRSKCVITYLRLNRTSSAVASSFLELVPDVEVLTLERVGVKKDFAQALLFDKSKPSWMAPKLKVMVLLDTTPRKKACNAFVDMIQSRLQIPLREEGKGCRLDFFRTKSTLRSNKSPPDPLVSSLQWRLSSEDVILFTHQEEDTTVTDMWSPRECIPQSPCPRGDSKPKLPGVIEPLWDRINLASLAQDR